jgi:hypothetical protein
MVFQLDGPMFPLIMKTQWTMLLWRIGVFFVMSSSLWGCLVSSLDLTTCIHWSRLNEVDVMILTLGMWVKIKAWNKLWSKECLRIQTQASPKMSNWLSHFGDWNFILSQFFGIYIKSNFKLLKRSWSVDIKNRLPYFVWRSKTQVMAKRLIKS